MNKEIVIHVVIGAAAVATIYWLWKRTALTTQAGGSVLLSPSGQNLGVPEPGTQLADEASQLMHFELSPFGDLMQQ
jgi:hypothetical protein